uniref:Putative Tfp pilus assembly protein, major pilin PilA n=1 Tax=mine drainage metagenome TaxID=410659 RepID=E6QS42_9ZZZZ
MQKKMEGFTLIELLITVAIIGILTAIAIPNYADYVKRGQLTDATMLANYRVMMEQYYQDNNSYGSGGVCGIAVPNAIPPTQYFTYTCVLDTTPGAATGQSFLLTAIGSTPPTAGFNFTINEQDVKTSSGSTIFGWLGNPACWSMKRDGSC